VKYRPHCETPYRHKSPLPASTALIPQSRTYTKGEIFETSNKTEQKEEILMLQVVVSRHLLCVIFIVILGLPQSALASSADDCRVPADPDILGLGIRLGIYFQIASNIYVGIVHPKEATNSLPITNIFMCGIFIALVHSTLNNGYTAGSMICVLWLVVLDLPLLVPILATAAASGGGSEIGMSFSTATVTLFRWIAFNVFNAWFWFHGLGVENDAQCQEPRVFFFANLSAYGNIRTWFKIEAVLGCLLSFNFLCMWVGLLYKFIFSYDRNTRHGGPAIKLPADPDDRTTMLAVLAVLIVGAFSLYGSLIVYIMLIPLFILSDSESQNNRVSLRQRIIIDTISGGLVLALLILPIELEIAWNKLDPVGTVSSTGQLLALTIGSFSLFRVGWLICTRDEELEGNVENGHGARRARRPYDVESGGGNHNADPDGHEAGEENHNRTPRAASPYNVEGSDGNRNVEDDDVPVAPSAVQEKFEGNVGEVEV